MSVDIILVSKLCSGIMDIRTVPLDVDNYLMPFKDFEDILYDNYGPKYDRKIFWRYSAELYFEITNYISFIGALNMAAENRIYVLLKDYTEPWQDNGTFIKIIDYLEDKAARRAHMDPYDVHIIQPHEVDSDQIDTELYEKSQEMTENRTDMDIIAYASRNVKQYSYYTEDFSTQSMLIKALRRGCSKDKRRLERPAEVVIERPGMKATKGGGDGSVADGKQPKKKQPKKK